MAATVGLVEYASPKRVALNLFGTPPALLRRSPSPRPLDERQPLLVRNKGLEAGLALDSVLDGVEFQLGSPFLTAALVLPLGGCKLPRSASAGASQPSLRPSAVILQPSNPGVEQDVLHGVDLPQPRNGMRHAILGPRVASVGRRHTQLVEPRRDRPEPQPLPPPGDHGLEGNESNRVVSVWQHLHVMAGGPRAHAPLEFQRRAAVWRELVTSKPVERLAARPPALSGQPLLGRDHSLGVLDEKVSGSLVLHGRNQHPTEELPLHIRRRDDLIAENQRDAVLREASLRQRHLERADVLRPTQSVAPHAEQPTDRVARLKLLAHLLEGRTLEIVPLEAIIEVKILVSPQMMSLHMLDIGQRRLDRHAHFGSTAKGSLELILQRHLLLRFAAAQVDPCLAFLISHHHLLLVLSGTRPTKAPDQLGQLVDHHIGDATSHEYVGPEMLRPMTGAMLVPPEEHRPDRWCQIIRANVLFPRLLHPADEARDHVAGGRHADRRRRNGAATLPHMELHDDAKLGDIRGVNTPHHASRSATDEPIPLEHRLRGAKHVGFEAAPGVQKVTVVGNRARHVGETDHASLRSPCTIDPAGHGRMTSCHAFHQYNSLVAVTIVLLSSCKVDGTVHRGGFVGSATSGQPTPRAPRRSERSAFSAAGLPAPLIHDLPGNQVRQQTPKPFRLGGKWFVILRALAILTVVSMPAVHAV